MIEKPPKPTLETHNVSFALLVFGGLLFAYFLAPRSQELALIYNKTDQLDKATSTYEAIYDDGARKGATIIPLARIYIREGQIDKAINLLEEYQQHQPNDSQALSLLADAYRDDQRHYHYLETLKQLAALSPKNHTHLQKLSQHQNYLGEHQQQSETLERIVKLQPNNYQAKIDLVHLHSALGQYHQAAEVMSEISDRHPASYNDKKIELHIQLLLASSQYESAMLVASDNIKRQKESHQHLRQYTSLLQEKNQDKLALALFERHPQISPKHLDLRITHIDLLTLYGQSESAHAHIAALQENHTLPVSLRVQLIDFYLNNKQPKKALNEAISLSHEQIPEWLYHSLLNTLLNNEHPSYSEHFINNVPEDLLEKQPLLAAKIDIHQKNREGAINWLKQAEKPHYQNKNKHIEIAELYLLLGESTAALNVFELLIEQGRISDTHWQNLAPLYIKTNRLSQGLTQFEKQRATKTSHNIEHGWILLSAAKGKRNQVKQWLASENSKLLTDADEINLYYAAADRKHYQTATVIAEHRLTKEPSVGHAILLAETWLTRQQALQAMAVLKPYRSLNNTSVNKLWNNAIQSTWKPGQAATPEILAYWQSQLENKRLSDDERRKIAFQLLDTGHKQQAQRQFQLLAENKTPNNSDLKQLIFLWGPLPEKQNVNWIIKQAEQSAPKHRLAWLNIIQQAGDYTYVANALAQSSHKDHRSLWRKNLSAQLAAGVITKQTFDRKLIQRALQTDEVKHLEKLAKHAFEHDSSIAQTSILELILKKDPSHANALLTIGLSAYFQQQHNKAINYLQQYLRNHKANWLTHFALANSLNGSSRLTEANPHYLATLQKLDNIPQQDFSQRLAYAQSLYQTRQLDAAHLAYKKLYRNNPTHADIRTDYIGLLIDRGNTQLARTLLNQAQNSL